jgi:hypothetical protein
MFSAQGGDLALSLDEVRIHLRCVLKKDPPRWCHCDVCARAVKKLNAKILLQRLDLKAHCGLREIQFFSGLAEAELFRNCPEDHETEVFEARHSIIRSPFYCVLQRCGSMTARFWARNIRCGLDLIRDIQRSRCLKVGE